MGGLGGAASIWRGCMRTRRHRSSPSISQSPKVRLHHGSAPSKCHKGFVKKPPFFRGATEIFGFPVSKCDAWPGAKRRGCLCLKGQSVALSPDLRLQLPNQQTWFKEYKDLFFFFFRKNKYISAQKATPAQSVLAAVALKDISEK